MPSRQNYDLSHFVFSAGELGRLQTLSVIPVIAGDSININMIANFRLAGLRRALILDAAADVFAFYVPHRHVYDGRGIENDFIKMVREGPNSTVNLPSVNLNHKYGFLGQHTLTGSVPRWRVDPYMRIYNRYFKHPTDDDINFPNNPNDHERKYGINCCYDKLVWTTGLDPTKSKSLGHNVYDATVSESTADIDLFAQREQVALFNSLSERDFFTTRYRDIIENMYDSLVNQDVEEIPTLISRERHYLQGFDIDGTADANFGQTSSKAFGNVSLDIPSWFVPEHGSIWIMVLLRFPTIHSREQHYLVSKPSPDYTTITGDYRMVSSQPPQELAVNEIFCDTNSNVKLGIQPYGQWYRMQPNNVHEVYDDLNGFPIMEFDPPDVIESHYIDPQRYDLVFQSPGMMGHWTSNCHINTDVYRVYPDAKTSLFL